MKKKLMQLVVILVVASFAFAGVLSAMPAKAASAVATPFIPEIEMVSGIVIQYADDSQAQSKIDEALKLAQDASITTEVTKGLAVGNGWYSLRFGQGLSTADATRIIDAVKVQSGVEAVSIDARIQVQRLVPPVVHTSTLYGTSYQVRSFGVADAYDAATPYVGKIKVSWKRPSTSTSRYDIERSTNGTNWTRVSTNWKSYAYRPSFTASNLDVGQRYYYRVRAKFGYKYRNASKWATANSTPTSLPKPTSLLNAPSISNATTFTPAWCSTTTAADRGGYATISYRIRIYNASNTLVKTVNAATPSAAVITGLDSAQTYTAKLSTVNPRGESAPSSATYSVINTAYNNSTLWHLNGTHGIKVPTAWNLSQGCNTVTVAIIDTGFTATPDLLANSWLNTDGSFYGYDFVQDSPGYPSHDGNDEDANPADPGDYLPANTNICGISPGQNPGSASSWHGTAVGGVAAGSGTASGTIGVAPKVKLLPIRALGPCGGGSTELARSILWASGISISGAPVNAHPAKVINLSIGTESPMSCYLNPVADAITSARARGVIVVTAAGNFGDNGLKASDSFPGNCPGTINVGATGNTGDKSFYTNLGWGSGNYSGVDVSAPGGDYNNSRNRGSIKVYIDTSSTSPSGSYGFTDYQGTSFAAPIVAGVVALMASVNPTIDFVEAANILQDTATPFASGTQCATLSANVGVTGYFECGYGIVNAGAAVAAALAAN